MAGAESARLGESARLMEPAGVAEQCAAGPATPRPAGEAGGSIRHSTPVPVRHPADAVAALSGPAAASPLAASAAAAGRPVLADLTFRDSHLERLYEAYHQRSKRGIVMGFAFFRAAILFFMSFRGVAAGDHFGALLLVLMSAGSLLPVVAAGSPPSQQASPLEQRLRVGVILAVDVVQAAVGCRCMHHLAPFQQEKLSSVAALAHVVHASGVLWTHFYSAFSPLTFRFLFMQQAAVCLVLMAGSGHICRYNAGLRMGYRYRTLKQMIGVAQQAQQATAADVALCMQCQAPLLLLPGFLAATWAAFRAERRLRLGFLGKLQEQHAAQQAQIIAQQAQRGDAGAAGLGSGDEAHAVVTLPADVARLRAEWVPSDLDFLANFAVPALGALWTYGRWALWPGAEAAAAALL